VKGLLAGGFLVRGKVKVSAEVSLAQFAYNLKRALAVVGLERLLVALRQFPPTPKPNASSDGAVRPLGVQSTLCR
jgi:hypothetical protein